MPAANNQQHPARNEPHWVDKWTLYVLAATLCAVIFYTCEAHRQSQTTAYALELDSRPYIQVGFSDCTTPQAGQKMECVLVMTNSGKIPADVTVKAVTVYSVTKLSAPTPPTVEDRQMVWVNASVLSHFTTPEALTEGQVNDMKAGRGFLYTWTIITYGRYHTKLCAEAPLLPSPDPNGPVIRNTAKLCNDHETSGAD